MPEPNDRTAVVLITLVRARPEHVDSVGARLQTVVRPSRTEADCVSYEVVQSASDPQDFAVVEAWASEAALDAHLARSAEFGVEHQLLPELESGPEIRRYRPFGRSP